jgi:hypothetical protein
VGDRSGKRIDRDSFHDIFSFKGAAQVLTLAGSIHAQYVWACSSCGCTLNSDWSGATLVYVSPGATVHANLHWQIYGLVQLPVYRRVNGLQIEPSCFYSTGALHILIRHFLWRHMRY